MNNRLLPVIFLFIFPFTLVAQEHCANNLILTLTSVNFDEGCDFLDFGGVDPEIQISDLDSNIIYINESEDFATVTGPIQNVPLELTYECCGIGYILSLGNYQIDLDSVGFNIEIYENDGACCDGYQLMGDDNYGNGIFVFHIVDDTTGTIDVGSCISYNYSLKVVEIFDDNPQVDCDDINGTTTNQNFEENTITVFPNPIFDKVYISSEEPSLQYELMNIHGDVFETGENSNELDVSSFPSGVYFLKIISSETKVLEVFRLLKI